MERLTQTSNKGGVAFTFDLDVTCQPSEIKKILKLAERPKYYEDLEEQGLLVRLLCKVEDTVYVLEENNYYTVMQVNKIEIKPTLYGDICYHLEPVRHRGHLCRYFEDDFGKTVFLTPEEAEEALKKMNERESNEEAR